MASVVCAGGRRSRKTHGRLQSPNGTHRKHLRPRFAIQADHRYCRCGNALRSNRKYHRTPIRSGLLLPGGMRKARSLFFVKVGRANTTHHLHVVRPESSYWKDHLAVRDLLRGDSILARRYATFKSEFAAACGNDRRGYRLAKGDFIERMIRRSGIQLHESTYNQHERN